MSGERELANVRSESLLMSGERESLLMSGERELVNVRRDSLLMSGVRAC